MSYNTSQKPIRIPLPEGQKMLLSRSAISQFRRAHKPTCEGKFGPWEKGEGRDEFVRLKALEWKIVDAEKRLGALLDGQRMELSKAEKNADAKERKFRDAQKAFGKNSQKASAAILALKNALNGHAQERENLVGCLKEYVAKVEGINEYLPESDEYRDALQNMKERTAQFGAVCGNVVIQSLDRLDMAIGSIEKDAINTEGGKDAKTRMEELGEEYDGFIEQIGRDGFGRKLARGEFENYAAANQGELDRKIKNAKDSARTYAQTVETGRVEFEEIPKIVRNAEETDGGREDIKHAIRLTRELAAIDIRALDGMEGIVKYENAIYDAARALCICARKAAQLEDEMDGVRAEHAIGAAKTEAMKFRYLKNEAKIRRIFGQGGNAGLLDLARGKASAASFRAGERKRRRERLPEQAETHAEKNDELPKQAFVWNGTECAEENVAPGKNGIYFNPIITAFAQKDMRNMADNARKAFEREMWQIPMNGNDEFLFSRGIQAYSHRVTKAYRMVYVKNGEEAVVWRMFINHKEYQAWGKELEQGARPEFYSLGRVNRNCASELVVFQNEMEYMRWKNSNGNGQKAE